MSEQTLDTILANHSIYIRMPEIKEKGSTPLLRPKDAKQAFAVWLTQIRQELSTVKHKGTIYEKYDFFTRNEIIVFIDGLLEKLK